MARREVLEGNRMSREFRRVGRQATNDVEKALVRCGLIVERDAKLLVRVDTGRLRASISSRLVDTPQNVARVQIGAGTTYAKELEYGTSRRPAYPFLNPALRMNQSRINRIIGDALRNALQSR